MMATGLAVAAGLPSRASAQSETTLIEPAIPIDYDRGRNVGVIDRARPDYDPLGIRRGAFTIYPRVDLALGVSDNVFLSPTSRDADIYAIVAPSVRVASDWNRHQLSASGGARLRRYADATRRDQGEYYLNTLGRYDLGSLSITGELQAARTQEEPFSGEVDSIVAALSRYDRVLGRVRGEYRGGRTRAILAYDHQEFDFAPIALASGIRFSQRDRNRNIDRLVGQYEYAFSPSLAAYGQASVSDIGYDVPLTPGVPNRDSTGFRAIGGVSVDFSGLYRGIVGIGYTGRSYKSARYKDVGGVSAEARLEYFPTELTTVTAALRRVIEDSSLANTSAFFDNRASLRVDHELLRNLILNAAGEYGRQIYIGSDQRSSVWRARAGARYLSSRTLSLQLDAYYARRARGGRVQENDVNEAQLLVSVTLQR